MDTSRDARAILEVIRNAASDVCELWARVQTQLHDDQRGLSARSRSRMRWLEATVAAATDILWALNHPTVCAHFVGERGRSRERYEQ